MFVTLVTEHFLFKFAFLQLLTVLKQKSDTIVFLEVLWNVLDKFFCDLIQFSWVPPEITMHKNKTQKNKSQMCYLKSWF